MSTVIERFQQAKEVWTNKTAINDAIPDGWTKNELFHATLHATNSASSRNIYFTLVPESEDFGNLAVFLSKTNQFYQIEATERGVEITVWLNQDIADNIDEIIEGYKQKSQAFVDKLVEKSDKKHDIIKTIIIEEKIDEVINNAMNQENNRGVYFSIGKTREFAANIPLLMGASGASLIQLSLNKWMTAADQLRAKSPDDPFPQEKIKPLLGDALKWKKFMIDFLDGESW
ncbi:MAG TPA: hypothetical protein VKM55_25975 [Candidatus Lokiarchaeia archaeon]|nr:hypothetical protein [Candidatus Lokiarchaeia archaeon]